MDDVDLKIAAMEKELTELRTRINALGERLGNGENAVRADLNPAIRRERELSSELHDLKVSSVRLTTTAVMMGQVMYGPPSRFLTRNKPPPVPMHGTPPARLRQRLAQQDKVARSSDATGKLVAIWRRLFGRK